MVVLIIEVVTFLPTLVKIGQKFSVRHQVSNFKMAAAAMLNSGYQVFIATIDVLIIEVVTFLPSLC